ncbi:hypothetical protein [Colwellia psychrerythraea]|uniref:Uncharacterized protein n=1 Tax=Colwellia psychrerythraea TaxID=28229 RepID=A0A099K9G8_COLPS|nr:hypothetical protein [Colwellia psychrerythraea]KGJ86925.1 hypothetical protein ND2E_0332 [Colwellia psychrerythraea]
MSTSSFLLMIGYAFRASLLVVFIITFNDHRSAISIASSSTATSNN